MNRDLFIDAYLASHAVAGTLAADQLDLLQRIFHSISNTSEDEYLRKAGTLMIWCNEKLTDKNKFDSQVAVIATKALELMFSEY